MKGTILIVDELRRAFYGEAWHGDSLFEILRGVTAAQAAARPIKTAHSIWELVLHISAWDGAARRRMTGVAVALTGAATGRAGSGEGRRALQLFVHVARAGATCGVSCGADRAAEEDVKAGLSRCGRCGP